MDRCEELKKLLDNVDDSAKTATTRVLDEMIFIESRLEELKRCPFIRTHPSDPSIQKATPAAKLYKEFLQQYNNCVKILLSVVGHGHEVETSPLREYLKGLRKSS